MNIYRRMRLMLLAAVSTVALAMAPAGLGDTPGPPVTATGSFQPTTALATQATAWTQQGWKLTSAGSAAASGQRVTPDVVLQRPEGTYTFTVLATKGSVTATPGSPSSPALTGAPVAGISSEAVHRSSACPSGRKAASTRRATASDVAYYICSYGTPAYVIWTSGNGIGLIDWEWHRWTDGKTDWTPAYGTCRATLCQVSAGFTPAATTDVLTAEVSNASYAHVTESGCGYP